jgi:hypothetical protein
MERYMLIAYLQFSNNARTAETFPQKTARIEFLCVHSNRSQRRFYMKRHHQIDKSPTVCHHHRIVWNHEKGDMPL